MSTTAVINYARDTADKIFDVKGARERCMKYRRRILDISQTVTALHVAPAFSCLEITDLIYNHFIRKNSDKSLKDVFLMSKGHGCLIQYVILEELGILSSNDLTTYCQPQGRLGAHPDYGLPGIAASTGSLGHGLGIAVGMAYAEKLKGSDVNIFVVLSDGELQEGSTWEAIVTAANLKLSNLVLFIDLNDFSGLERMSEAHRAFYPVDKKLQAFGWDVANVNGHDANAMHNAVVSSVRQEPLAIICSTVKGKGVSYMEHVPIWHYRSPNPTEYKQAIEELAEIMS